MQKIEKLEIEENLNFVISVLNYDTVEPPRIGAFLAENYVILE